jgi:hypothetical protein
MSVLQRLFAKCQQSATGAEASQIRRLLGTCTACGSPDFSGHRYTRVASSVVEDKAANRRLFELAEKGDWESLIRSSTWDHTRDNLEWFAIKCPTGHLQVATILSPFELYQSDRLLTTQEISGSIEKAELESRLSEAQWKPLSAGAEST